MAKVSDGDARAIANRAAGFSRPRVPSAGRDVAISFKPAKKVAIKPSERGTRRAVPESESKPAPAPTVKPSLTKSMYKAFGGGNVSKPTRERIQHQMDKGVKPDTQIKTNPDVPKTEKIAAPKAPAVRKFITQRPKKAAPKPSLPKPKVVVKPKTGPTKKLTPAQIKAQRKMGARSKLGPEGTNPRTIGKPDRQLANTRQIISGVTGSGGFSDIGRGGGRMGQIK